MLFLLLTLAATGLLCCLAGFAPAKLRGRKPSRRDALSALGLFGAVWLFAVCAYHRPGLRVGFDLFRSLAITALCGWAGVCQAGLRVLRGRGPKWMLPLLAVVALGAELFVFNIAYFNTHSYQPFQLRDCLDPGINAQIVDGRMVLDEEHSYLRFLNINRPIYNLSLDDLQNESTEPLEQNSLISFKVAVTDSANAALADFGVWQVGLGAPRSHVISFDMTGQIGTLAFGTNGYSDTDSVLPIHFSISGITANARRPLALSPLRCLVFFLLLAAVYTLRPHGLLWRAPWLESGVSARVAAGVVAVLLAGLVAVVPFWQPRNTGLATKDYNTAYWDGKSTVSFVYQQYGALAHSLLNGRLDLEKDPPEELLAMENPYDATARSANDVHGVLWDHALYNGRYYVYFGVVPCLLFQLPFEALTGIQNLAYAPCMVVLGWLFLLGTFGMLHQAVRRWFPHAPAAAYLLAVLAVATGSGLYSLLVRPYIYEYAILAGAAFLVLGLWQWLAAANTPADDTGKNRRAMLAHLALGSLCVALVAGCRPQMELFAVLALPIFWRRYVTEKRLRSRAGAGEAVAFLLPVVLVAAGLMAYNAARFGSPFDFGANYNLTGNDMTQRGWNPVRVGPAVFTMLFDLPRVMGVFPYLQEVDLQTNAIIRTISERFVGSLFGTAPFLWAAALALPKRGRALLAKPGLRGLVGAVLAAVLLITVVDCQMAGVLSRYLMDFSPLMFFAASLCWLALDHRLSRRKAHGLAMAVPLLDTVRLTMALTVGWSVFYRFSALFAASPKMQGMNAALYYQTSRLLQFWM